MCIFMLFISITLLILHNHLVTVVEPTLFVFLISKPHVCVLPDVTLHRPADQDLDGVQPVPPHDGQHRQRGSGEQYGGRIFKSLFICNFSAILFFFFFFRPFLTIRTKKVKIIQPIMGFSFKGNRLGKPTH